MTFGKNTHTHTKEHDLGADPDPFPKGKGEWCDWGKYCGEFNTTAGNTKHQVRVSDDTGGVNACNMLKKECPDNCGNAYKFGWKTNNAYWHGDWSDGNGWVDKNLQCPDATLPVDRFPRTQGKAGTGFCKWGAKCSTKNGGGMYFTGSNNTPAPSRDEHQIRVSADAAGSEICSKLFEASCYNNNSDVDVCNAIYKQGLDPDKGVHNAYWHKDWDTGGGWDPDSSCH
jgi:hypothetical protein